MPLGAQIAVAIFAILGVMELFAALATAPSKTGSIFYLMLALAAVTARVKVRLPGGSTLSPLTSIVLAALMVLGPHSAVVIGVVGILFPDTLTMARRLYFATPIRIRRRLVRRRRCACWEPSCAYRR